MLDIFRSWYHRHFSEPQAVLLAVALIIIAMLLVLFGGVMAPLLIAMIFAYLLDGMVAKMEALRIPRIIVVTLVICLFAFFCLVLIFGLLPLLSRQLAQLLVELPRMFAEGKQQLMQLGQDYPNIVGALQLDQIVNSLRSEVVSIGQAVLSFSLANVVNVLAFGVYAVLVPLMVFFMLKDKALLMGWAQQFLPRQTELSMRVWTEVDQKIANYIRGKFIEVMIISIVSYVTFAVLGLNYSLLLALLVGLSVIIPFVGAVAVTIPVVSIAFFQWGMGPEFSYLVIAYFVIQILDGNLLVPVLFSEVVNLHPLAIIVAVIFFGGLWGVWGVFFAIPLATLVQALLNAWPSMRRVQVEKF